MKNKNKILTKIILFIVLIMNSTLVNAENQESSFNLNITPNQKNAKPGEEITVLVEATNINMGNSGINVLEGTIVYDENVIEEIKSDSLTAQNGWTVTYNDESSILNGKFLAVNLSEGIKENTKLFSITFKIKNDITKNTETNIEIKDITSNNGIDLINIGNKKLKLNIEVQNTTQTENTIENIVPDQTTNTNNQQTVEDTTAKTEIPNTGNKYIIICLIVIAIITLVILSIKNHLMKGIK